MGTELAKSSELSNNLTLTDEDKKQAKEYAKTLKLDEKNSVINYGQDVQDGLSSFSQSMLDQVSNNEAGDIGKQLTSLMYKMKKTNPQSMQRQGNWLMKLFHKADESVYQLRSRYQEIGNQIDEMSYQLSAKVEELSKYNSKLEELYANNLEYYKKIKVLELGAQMKRDELKNQLEEAGKDPQGFNDQEGLAQLQDFYNSVDKRVYDLKLAEEVSVQQAPQIRVIQQTNTTLMKKVHSSIHTSIPLWKDQAFIAVALGKQKQVLNAQKWVTDTTNDMLKQNSEMIKSASVDAAKQNEEGFISVDTLKQT